MRDRNVDRLGCGMGSAAQSSRAYKTDSYVKAFERNAMISEIRQDEVIRMAKIAKLPTYFRTGELVNLKELEDFAELVRFNVGEARLNHCIELLEKRGHKDAADLLRGEG
jgi:hypothetical protein